MITNNYIGMLNGVENIILNVMTITLVPAGFPLNFKLARLVEILSPAERDEIKRNRSETKPEQELGTCKFHDTKPLEYYCENCKVLICGQCMITTHRKHEEVSYAKDVLPQHLQVLASLVPAANTAASIACVTSEQLKEDIKEMKKQGSEKVRAIQGYFSRLRQVLSDREDKLVEVVRQEMQEKEDTLLKKQHVIQMSLEDIRRDVQVGYEPWSLKSTPELYGCYLHFGPNFIYHISLSSLRSLIPSLTPPFLSRALRPSTASRKMISAFWVRKQESNQG